MVFLGQAAQMVVGMLACENWYVTSPAVMTAAGTAFGKLMLVSKSFCTDGNHLRLFFTLLQTESLPAAMRNSLVIAAGDLCIRFPNQVRQPHPQWRLQQKPPKNPIPVLSSTLENSL